MSYFSSLTFQDDVYHDAFGRLKVSVPEPLFDNMSEYGNNTFFWETKAVNGTLSHVANQNAVRLSTNGTASGNYLYRATRKYMRYQPGRSLNIEMTFVMGATATNSRARIGYFDGNNGIFLQRATGASTTTVSVVRRTNVSGTPSDTDTVNQADWNVDKFDGTGKSGKTLDLTKSNILFIQLQYLGVGRAQIGFVIDGIPYVAHQFLNANVLSTVYMSTGCLPLRGEVENTGLSGGTLTMDMICASVSSGGRGNELIQWSRSIGATPISTGTSFLPIISIRAATLFGGTGGGGSIVNRGYIEPLHFDITVTGQIHEFQILRNATLTAPSWQANNALSIADYDISASGYSGGILLESGYIAASATVRTSAMVSNLISQPLVYTGLNDIQDVITIVARTVTGSGTSYGAITWKEEY